MSRPKPRRGSGASRPKDLAKIHIGAQELGLIRTGDDSAYRDMLWAVARVRSAKDLDAGGREAVLRHLVACGWKQTPPKAARYERGTPAALIRHLWTELHRAGAVRDESDRALRRYIATHAPRVARGVTEVAAQHLDGATAAAVIEQLKAWLERL